MPRSCIANLASTRCEATFKPPAPNPALDSFRGGVAVLRRDGEVARHVATKVLTFWPLFGKRAFAREILETTRTSTDVEAAGLTGSAADTSMTRTGNNYSAGSASWTSSSPTPAPGRNT